MSIELLTPRLTPDAIYYAVIFNDEAQVFNGTTFEDFVDANYASYVVPLTELGTSSGRYAADAPAAIGSIVPCSYEVLRQIGVSPALTDELEAQGTFNGNGGDIPPEPETGLVYLAIARRQSSRYAIDSDEEGAAFTSFRKKKT